MIALGTDPVRMSVYAPIDAMPPHLAIAQIGLVDHDMGKNHAVELAIKADVKQTLAALLPVLKRRGGAGLVARSKAGLAAIAAQQSNWTARRKALSATVAETSAKTPIDPDFATLTLIDALPARAILFDEALTSGRYVGAFREHKERYGYHALASGGIGWALPASVGACFANPGCPVVCYTGDGSSIHNCTARSNTQTGIQVTSACHVFANTCDSNATGIGVSMSGGTSGDRNRIDGNSCSRNQVGISINGITNLTIRNHAGGNTTQSYSITGPLLNKTGPIVTDNGTITSNSPWANFE